MTVTMYRDEDFDDPRRMKVGRDGMALDHQLRGHANKHLTDGVVSAEMLPICAALAFIESKAARTKALAQLHAHGYVHLEGESCDSKDCPAALRPVDAGAVLVHDWWRNQERREKVIERRDRNNRKKDLLGDAFLVAQLIRRDGHHCRYCGCPVRKTSEKDTRSKNKLTIDHIDPDGPNDIENLVIACLSCNSRKNRRTPEAAGMTLRPTPRLAKLAHLEGEDDAPWNTSDQTENRTTDQTTDQDATMENRTTDQTTDQDATMENPTTDQTTDQTTDHESLACGRVAPACDRPLGQDQDGTRTGPGLGAGRGLVEGLVPGQVGAGKPQRGRRPDDQDGER